MKFADLHDSLYLKLKVNTPLERRKLLTEEMKSLTDKQIHCFNCSGTCCTYSANSMQITPLEAFEIITSLEVTAENISEIKTKLQKSIQDYRLDHEIFLGKKKNSHLRKTYTCPFFVAGSKGCTIKKELKPYGCLGFNPRIENDNGSLCLSNTPLLETRENEQMDSEKNANRFLREELKLDWEKLEIPKAVLKILDHLYP